MQMKQPVVWLVVGGGNAREHATFLRLDRELGSDRVGFYLTGSNAFLSGRANVLEASTGKSLDDAINFFAPERILLLSPNELLSGLAEGVHRYSIPCLAVSPAIAALEASKLSSKKMMLAYGVPTPMSMAVESVEEALDLVSQHWKDGELEFVIKSDGMLANASHRVVVPSTREAAIEVLQTWEGVVGRVSGQAPLLIEQKLYGEELSFHVLVDPTTYRVMPYVTDYKRLRNGDLGPNTHGMGAVATTVPEYAAVLRQVESEVLLPSLRLLRALDPNAALILYVGVMMTRDGPRVLEYNVRSGNPEWVALLQLLESSVHLLFDALLQRELHRYHPTYKPDTYSVVAMVNQKGYPEEEIFTSKQIQGFEWVSSGVEILSDGTTGSSEGEKFTSSGRVLGAATFGSSIESCRIRLYEALTHIRFEDMEFRTDIGLKFC
jgi:phosphoribosylamine--glycine ligase